MGSDSEDMLTRVVVLILLVCTAHAQNNLGDECSNQCEEGNPYHWCGKMRQDSFGRVLRCAEGTMIGQACIDSCSSKDESYFWCWTNNHEVGTGSDWWNYCGVEGHTKKGVPCVGVCARQGENYWWCRTDKVDSGAWDYCSPPGQVTQDMAKLAEMSVLVEDTVTSGATLGSLAVAGITAHLSPTLQRRSSLREEVNVQGSVTG